LKDRSGNVVASMICGKEHMRSMPANTPSPYGMGGGYPDGRYVLADGRACLISEPLSGIPNRVQDWMKTDIANVMAADTQEIMITEGEKALTLRRSDGGTLELADLTENEEMDTGKVNGLGNLLSYLTFDDVADPALSDETLGFDHPITYSARNRKNQVFTLTAGGSPEGSDHRYVRFSASYIPPKDTPADNPENVANDGEGAAADKDTAAAAGKMAAEEAQRKQQEQAALAAEVKEITDRVQHWTYIIPGHKLNDLSADRSSFVKEKEAEEEAATEE